MSNQDPTIPSVEVFLTAHELAQRWRCSGETLKRRRRSGQLPAYKLGRSVRFKLADVLAFEAQARI